MVSALNVANTILITAFDDDIDITPMKLQKLIYFTYKSYLINTGTSLFSERFEPWRYGPVISSVYDEFRHYGSNYIKEYHRDNDGDVYFIPLYNDDEFSYSFEYVWNTYSKYDGIYLSSLTHRMNTAWYKAIENGKPFLSDDDIKSEEWSK